MKSRTQVDWSKHTLTSNETPELKVHHLHIPGMYQDSVKFINTQGICAVTGDYGNWIFCREFVPAADNYVSDGYWCEKLRNSSTQSSHQFDAEMARYEIEQLRKDEDLTEEESEWLDELESAADNGEYSYIACAMNRPESFDTENIPIGRSVHIWLLTVFDAFDEICRRLKDQKDNHA
jgi:hypothetical protein